jgi:hypothetical protein
VTILLINAKNPVRNVLINNKSQNALG